MEDLLKLMENFKKVGRAPLPQPGFASDYGSVFGDCNPDSIQTRILKLESQYEL